jgi:hypothetical protein
LEHLLVMAERAATVKSRRPDVASFMLDPTSALDRLACELGRREYRPGASRGFVIYEPTRRVIAALPFRDRVVQHACGRPSLERVTVLTQRKPMLLLRFVGALLLPLVARRASALPSVNLCAHDPEHQATPSPRLRRS